MYPRWWQSLWNLKVPPKIKIFLWRLFQNAIPTRANLARRGIKLHKSCPRCGEVKETSLHTFFDCPFAQSLWDDSMSLLKCHPYGLSYFAKNIWRKLFFPKTL
ncbi:hypothetical protein UlMin_038117 [Ulmus minor]